MIVDDENFARKSGEDNLFGECVDLSQEVCVLRFNAQADFPEEEPCQQPGRDGSDSESGEPPACKVFRTSVDNDQQAGGPNTDDAYTDKPDAEDGSDNEGGGVDEPDEESDTDDENEDADEFSTRDAMDDCQSVSVCLSGFDKMLSL